MSGSSGIIHPQTLERRQGSSRRDRMRGRVGHNPEENGKLHHHFQTSKRQSANFFVLPKRPKF